MRRMTRQKGTRKIYVDDDDDDDDDEMMMKRWVCTGINPLHFFRVRECQDLYAANKWIISMLSSLAVFITEFCFDRLPQMAVIKEIVQLLPICSISWPSLFCFCFGLKQSQGTKPISRNGYGPDWLRRFIDPIAMPCWWAPIRAKQLPMATTARVIWLCAYVRYWPDRGLVHACPLL